MPSILTFAVLITLQVLVLYAAPIEVEAVSSSSTVIHWETAVGALLNDARYKIIRQLMRGSFGEIYIAMDTRDSTRTMVAVKVSRHTTDDDAESNLGMMEQEARIMQQYFCEKSDRRNGVVEVLDHFPCGNRQYCMVMELLACDLIQHSFDLQTRPVAARLRRIQKIARDILPVLSELARRRIVHSDVKPDNILWDRNADAYKLADFGLAFNSMSPPPQGELRGSLVYLPPDAFVQLRTSFASDMWAFGGTLLDTFLSDSAFDSGTMHLQEELPRNWVEWIGPIPEWLKLGLRQAGFIVPDKSYNLPLLDQLAIRSPAPGMRNFIDFLRKCFDYHPLTRMTATGALEHPFVTGDRY